MRLTARSSVYLKRACHPSRQCVSKGGSSGAQEQHALARTCMMRMATMQTSLGTPHCGPLHSKPAGPLSMFEGLAVKRLGSLHGGHGSCQSHRMHAQELRFRGTLSNAHHRFVSISHEVLSDFLGCRSWTPKPRQHALRRHECSRIQPFHEVSIAHGDSAVVSQPRG
jgi:hypothetical protein